MQRFLSRFVWVTASSVLLSSAGLDLCSQACLRAAFLPHAGQARAFLRAAPIPWLQLKVVFSPLLVFRVMLWRFLNIPLVRTRASCLSCARPRDAFGDHGTDCRRGRGAHQRHRRVQDLLFHAFRDSGLKVSRETRHLLPVSNQSLEICRFVNLQQPISTRPLMCPSRIRCNPGRFPMQQFMPAIKVVCPRKRR